MSFPTSRRPLGMATAAPALVALVLGASGCMDYTIETTLEADGTGVRVERMEITRSDASNLSERDVRALTASSREKEWRTSHRVESDGDTTWVLERRSDVRTLRDWSDPARRTLILGTVPAKAEDRLGYVRLGDVAFRSSIQVGVSRRSDGTSLVSYRESFLWDQAVDAIVEFLVQDLDRALSERYPRLSAGERGSVVGFARARIWVAGEEGLFFGENEAEAVARAAEGTAEQAVKIVRVRYPEASVDELRTLVVERLDMEDEQLGRLFEQTLPGLNLGFNTTVVFRLTLPGAVGATNASSRDGNVLEWQFNPLDNLMAPLEVFAESVVGG